MQFASVMAVVEPQGPKDIDIGSQNSNDQVIFTALELGKRFQAETLLLHVLPPNSDVLMMGPEVGQAGAMSAQASTILQGIEAQITQRQEYFESLYTRHVAAFEPFLNIDAEAEIPGWQPSSFSVRKITPTGHECREIARLGRLADLIVIAAPVGTDRVRRRSASAMPCRCLNSPPPLMSSTWRRGASAPIPATLPPIYGCTASRHLRIPFPFRIVPSPTCCLALPEITRRACW